MLVNKTFNLYSYLVVASNSCSSVHRFPAEPFACLDALFRIHSSISYKLFILHF